MTGTITKKFLTALAASTLMLGAAQAGGFSRNTADTDILFEEGNFNLRTGITFVSPTRNISKAVGNEKLVGTSYTNNYVMPSAAVKMNLVDNLRCAGTMNTPYGGSAGYDTPTRLGDPIYQSTGGFGVRINQGKSKEEFSVNELGLTCAVRFQAGPGNFWVLGGGYLESFNYNRLNMFGLPGDAPAAWGTANLTLESQAAGWRAGVAYDIPEIALRAQLLYRSGTEHSATGQMNFDGTITALVPGLERPEGGEYLPAVGSGELPQSVELKLQSGIAPGWLGFAQVKWTDWSVMDQLVVNYGRVETNDYFWRDGWTVTAGVGHAFNETISGLVALSWDRGTGTGFDLSSDTWTLASGLSFKDKIGGELRLGGAVTYIASAEETRHRPDNADAAKGFIGVDAGYAIAGNVGYAIKW